MRILTGTLRCCPLKSGATESIKQTGVGLLLQSLKFSGDLYRKGVSTMLICPVAASGIIAVTNVNVINQNFFIKSVVRIIFFFGDNFFLM
jgi:hypothetical protein